MPYEQPSFGNMIVQAWNEAQQRSDQMKQQESNRAYQEGRDKVSDANATREFASAEDWHKTQAEWHTADILAKQGDPYADEAVKRQDAGYQIFNPAEQSSSQVAYDAWVATVPPEVIATGRVPRKLLFRPPTSADYQASLDVNRKSVDSGSMPKEQAINAASAQFGGTSGLAGYLGAKPVETKPTIPNAPMLQGFAAQNALSQTPSTFRDNTSAELGDMAYSDPYKVQLDRQKMQAKDANDKFLMLIKANPSLPDNATTRYNFGMQATGDPAIAGMLSAMKSTTGAQDNTFTVGKQNADTNTFKANTDAEYKHSMVEINGRRLTLTQTNQQAQLRLGYARLKLQEAKDGKVNPKTDADIQNKASKAITDAQSAKAAIMGLASEATSPADKQAYSSMIAVQDNVIAVNTKLLNSGGGGTSSGPTYGGTGKDPHVNRSGWQSRIRDSRSKGNSNETIKAALIDYGWSPAGADKLLQTTR